MNRNTHAWIAVRAVGLLEEDGTVTGLVKLAKPHLTQAATGAWIPDLQDAKRGGSKTENHVLKMLPYKGDHPERFVADKKETLKRLGPAREMSSYLNKDTSLNGTWWNTPYRGNVPKPGMHLANRAMALSITGADLLLLGNAEVDGLLPGAVKFIKDVVPEARTRAEQAALFLFMLSHFVADSCMPCHCDGRWMMGYDRGLHKELEEYWMDQLPDLFKKDRLVKDDPGSDNILAEAKKADAIFGYSSKGKVPGLVDKDIWKEMINICRGSFALAGILAPEKDYPYDSRSKAKVKFANFDPPLKEITAVVLQDAVLNTAIVWKHVWEKASVKPKKAK